MHECDVILSFDICERKSMLSEGYVFYPGIGYSKRELYCATIGSEEWERVQRKATVRSVSLKENLLTGLSLGMSTTEELGADRRFVEIALGHWSRHIGSLVAYIESVMEMVEEQFHGIEIGLLAEEGVLDRCTRKYRYEHTEELYGAIRSKRLIQELAVVVSMKRYGARCKYRLVRVEPTVHRVREGACQPKGMRKLSDAGFVELVKIGGWLEWIVAIKAGTKEIQTECSDARIVCKENRKIDELTKDLIAYFLPETCRELLRREQLRVKRRKGFGWCTFKHFHIMDDGFRFGVASLAVEGVKLASLQHGAGYQTSRYFEAESIEQTKVDKFLCFGLEQRENDKTLGVIPDRDMITEKLRLTIKRNAKSGSDKYAIVADGLPLQLYTFNTVEYYLRQLQHASRVAKCLERAGCRYCIRLHPTATDIKMVDGELMEFREYIDDNSQSITKMRADGYKPIYLYESSQTLADIAYDLEFVPYFSREALALMKEDVASLYMGHERNMIKQDRSLRYLEREMGIDGSGCGLKELKRRYARPVVGRV